MTYRALRIIRRARRRELLRLERELARGFGKMKDPFAWRESDPQAFAHRRSSVRHDRVVDASTSAFNSR